ncbi:hypothetical protein [Flavobacterium sp.]|jgi:hypothetical protein|uniref:hypothetical protein n=1 Tax=Flavobacterium sp. TaxID=239 RepID=UPI0037C07146
MKKLVFLLVCISAFLFNSCSDSDSDSPQNSTSFVVDGITYDLPATQGIVNVVSPDAIEVNGSMYNRNTFIINGIKGMTDVATVTFDLFLKSGQSLAGDYQISTDQDEDNPIDLENILASQNRACLGWTSLVAKTNIISQSSVSGNAPTGTVKIISNGGNNYTIQYTGNFKNIDQVENIQVTMNITGAVSNGS